MKSTLLLSLKAEYKNLTGQDPPLTQPQQQQQSQSSKKEKLKQQQQEKQQPKKQQQSNEDAKNKKKETKLGMQTKKSENFSEWYTEVITKSGMVDYYDISGCYVLWEWSFSIWGEDNRIFE